MSDIGGLFLPLRGEINLKTDVPDGIERGKSIMKFWKSTIIVFAFLTMTILSTTVGYAQFWETLLGVGSAMLENHIENSSSYSSQEKESMRNNINTINSAINANQNARNATKDAYQGNYTGTVIQSTQTIMNAAGNHSYDTYLNSANQINKANREYEQDIQNGMDREAALDKRNTTIGNSAAESAIELQDRIAREKIEKNRQQREAERQFSGNNNYYSENSSYETSNMKSFTSNTSNVKVSSPNNSINKNRDNNVNKNRSFNSNAKTLSSTNSAVFKTDNGDFVFLSIPIRYLREGHSLSYYNHSDNAIRFSCDKASVSVKYVGDNIEQTFTSACSFVMPAHYEGKMEWSNVFPNYSNKLSDAFAIESIRVLFEDTRITNED